MGITKTELFTDEQNELATVAKALAHPARIAILQHILKQQTCVNTDLVQELGLAQATISQHLRELKDSGLIRGTVEGVRLNYCVDAGHWKAVKAQLNQLFDGFEPAINGDCC